MPYTDDLVRMLSSSGLTVQQIADQSGVPASTINRMLSGQTEEPTFSNIANVVKAMGGSLDELVGITDKTVVETKTINSDERIINLYERSLTSKNSWIKRLFIINMVLIAFIIGILIYDLANPDRGWYREVIEAMNNYGSTNIKDFFEYVKGIFRV